MAFAATGSGQPEKGVTPWATRRARRIKLKSTGSTMPKKQRPQNRSRTNRNPGPRNLRANKLSPPNNERGQDCS